MTLPWQPLQPDLIFNFDNMNVHHYSSIYTVVNTYLHWLHPQHIVAAPPTVRVNCAKLQNIMDYWFAVLNVQTNSREERRNTIIIVVWSVAWQRYHYYPCYMTKKCCCKIEYLVLWIQFLCQLRLKSLVEDWNRFQAYGDEMVVSSPDPPFLAGRRARGGHETNEMARHVLCDKIEFSKLNAIWCVRKMKSLPVKFNWRKSPRTLRHDDIEAG